MWILNEVILRFEENSKLLGLRLGVVIFFIDCLVKEF